MSDIQRGPEVKPYDRWDLLLRRVKKSDTVRLPSFFRGLGAGVLGYASVEEDGQLDSILAFNLQSEKLPTGKLMFGIDITHLAVAPERHRSPYLAAAKLLDASFGKMRGVAFATLSDPDPEAANLWTTIVDAAGEDGRPHASVRTNRLALAAKNIASAVNQELYYDTLLTHRYPVK